MARALDLGYAISKTEELQGCGDRDLRLRAVRIARHLRGTSGIQITHERLRRLPPQMCEEFLKISPEECRAFGEPSMQAHPVDDLMGRWGVTGEALVAELVRQNPDLWQGLATAEVKQSTLVIRGPEKLRVLAGRCVQAWRGESEEPAIPARPPKSMGFFRTWDFPCRPTGTRPKRGSAGSARLSWRRERL